MSSVIFYIMAACFLIGAVDYVTEGRLQISKSFETGIGMMGTLFLGMGGILYLSAFIARILSKIFIPLSDITGIDPSMFSSLLIAVDMGGLNIAKEIAKTEQLAYFSGVLVASSFGAMTCFLIPMGISLIRRNELVYYFNGLLISLIPISLSCILGGILIGISITTLLINMSVVIVFSLIMTIGVFKFSSLVISFFKISGKLVQIINIIGVVYMGVNMTLPSPLLPVIGDYKETLVVVGRVGVFLGGAFVALNILERVFVRFFKKLSSLLNINMVSISNLIINFITAVPVLKLFDQLDSKGKIIASAMAIAASSTIGAQLAYITVNAKDYVPVFLFSKLMAFVFCIVIIILIYKKKKVNSEVVR